MRQFTRVKRFSAVGVLLIGSLLFATLAIADIMPGSSNTSLSQDVAYTQVSLSKPRDAVAGDMLIASISVNGGAPAVVTAPSGWTLIARTDNDSNVGIASYYKFVGSSEPSSYTWTISPQTRAVGGITRYTGVDSGSPIDVVASSTGRGISATAPSITTSQASDTVIALFAADTGTNNSPLFSTSTGMTTRYGVKNTPFGPTAAEQDRAQAVAGTVGSMSSTFSSGPQHDWAAQTIAVKMQNRADVSLLVAAGGGGGGGSGPNDSGGGGGSGGVIISTANVGVGSYTIVVGAGGTGGPSTTTGDPSNGTQGGNSSALSYTAIGGGYGSYNGGGNPSGAPAGAGGSGGGSGGSGAYSSQGGTATTGQGNNGGMNIANVTGGGGGGGASTVGQDGQLNFNGGNGGDGVSSAISGTTSTYGGGGGGGTGAGGNNGTSAGIGGSGGGGNGGLQANGSNATANTGGGGGGAGWGYHVGGDGASGVVIISYPTGSLTATGGTVTTSGGYTVHTFTSSGTFTVTNI
ncbi:glycine-rich domain-containing protein [Bradyrhizobium acaciae]|uniref:glycine-rich domain-containing protein n=1 Tax=Bradyrhizobium acaciae TaxID=2683706 RepID=UPI001E2DF7CF|nr:hypothetical protein [Bradyrhizobium acaciae]MCC8977604.1 hypothetical protein [Bradyrhizobium acaciae]